MKKSESGSTGSFPADADPLVAGSGRRSGADRKSDQPGQSRSGAARGGDDLYTRCSDLALFPNRGRIGRVAGTCELVLAPLPYIVVYRVNPDSVDIVRIFHSAHNWP
jgi:plasmid stabilization system protein ParE